MSLPPKLIRLKSGLPLKVFLALFGGLPRGRETGGPSISVGMFESPPAIKSRIRLARESDSLVRAG